MDLEAREWQCWGTFVPPRRMNQNIPKYKKDFVLISSWIQTNKKQNKKDGDVVHI